MQLLTQSAALAACSLSRSQWSSESTRATAPTTTVQDVQPRIRTDLHGREGVERGGGTAGVCEGGVGDG